MVRRSTRMLMQRRLAPEWLDEMDPLDPRAARSRQDLRRVNRLMGNLGTVTKALEECALTRVERIVELGGGDGTFLLELARNFSPRWPSVRVTLVDRLETVADQTRAALRKLGWELETVQAEAGDWLEQSQGGGVMMANLFLHHFGKESLACLLALAAARAEALVACEPRRSLFSLAASAALGLVGCNAVTRHDAVVSVRAGFAGNELSALWPRGGGWVTKEWPAGLFSHGFAAVRQTSRLPPGA